MRLLYQLFLPFLICVTILREEREDKVVIDETTVPLPLPSADTGNANETLHSLLLDSRQQEAC